MLNRHTWINDPDAPSIDITGYATWRCPSGHVSEVWLKFNGNYAYGGYAWDFCEHCSHHPNVLQDTKAHPDDLLTMARRKAHHTGPVPTTDVRGGQHYVLTRHQVQPNHVPRPPYLAASTEPDHQDARLGDPDQITQEMKINHTDPGFETRFVFDHGAAGHIPGNVDEMTNITEAVIPHPSRARVRRPDVLPESRQSSNQSRAIITKEVSGTTTR